MSDEEDDEDDESTEEESEEATGEQGLDAASLADLAQQFSQVFAKDLGALLGPSAELSVTGTAATEPGELDCPGPVIDQRAGSEGAEPRAVHLLCPVPDAISLGALQAGLEGDAVGEARDAGDFGEVGDVVPTGSGGFRHDDLTGKFCLTLNLVPAL